MTRPSVMVSEHQTGIDPRLGRHRGVAMRLLSPLLPLQMRDCSRRGSAFTVLSPAFTPSNFLAPLEYILDPSLHPSALVTLWPLPLPVRWLYFPN